MEQINFDSNQKVNQNRNNISNQGVSMQNSQTKNINFDGVLSDVSNDQSDAKGRSIIKNLAQKYNIYITVTPNDTDKNTIHEGQLNVTESSGYNNSVIIPRNLLNKMATDPKTMKSVEYAIKSDIDAFKKGETYRVITGDKSISSPLTFSEDGNWEKWGMGMTNSTSNNFNLDSSKLKITQSDQEESSNNTTKNKFTTSHVSSLGNFAQTKSSHLNTGTVKFVIENGMAQYAYVDGIKMDLADMLLKNKSKLKERIIEKYNKTDAEKLEEIFEV